MTAPLKRHPLRWCFSTLGCVDLTFPEICQLAAEFSIPGIELRGIAGRMDMPDYCAEQNLTPQLIHDTCQSSSTQLVVAGSSAKLTSASDQDRAELLSFGSWAAAAGIPCVRVFGGGTWGTPLTEADYARGVELVRWWRRENASRQWHVELLLETHDAFSGSEPCLKLNEGLEEPLRVIWDSHHTWRIGGESPEFTLKQIGPLIRHVHFKDSVDRPSARHPYTYVGLGEGQMPLTEVIQLLRDRRFEGFVSLEWERKWHPYLAPLREALATLTQQPWFAAADNERSTSSLTR